MLANVAQELAESVAEGLGMPLPAAQPRAMPNLPVPEVASSPALSLFSRPGDGNIRMRRIAILVASGINGRAAAALRAGLSREQAVTRFVGIRLGAVQSADGDQMEADITFETMPSVLFDAVVVLGGQEESTVLARSGEAVEFIRDQYRHCKPILVLKGGKSLVENAGVKFTLPSGELDPGVLYFEDQDCNVILPQFIEAIAAHRHFEREIEPRGS
jgi:catalase